MKLEFDQLRCKHPGPYRDIAPSLVQPGDNGHAVLVDADGQVPTGDETQAAAVRTCPKRALWLDL